MFNCPQFLLNVVAYELGIAPCALEAKIKDSDEATIKRIEAVIFWVDERVKSRRIVQPLKVPPR